MSFNNFYIKLGAFVSDIFISKRVLIENVFKRKFAKNAFICYYTHPFYRKFNGGHTNQKENIIMAEVFDELGFNVDVGRYDSKILSMIIPKKRYDVIIGLDPNFENLVRKMHPEKSIYYATGSYYEFQNKAENKRIEEVKTKTKQQLYPKRTVRMHNSLKSADAVILIGNEQTKSTYPNWIKDIHTINVTAASFWPMSKVVLKKDWNEAKKNFLWFGSLGAIHKGLDLLLEVFKGRPDLNLHICGPLSWEPDFLEAYKDELNNYNNIINYGLIDPAGKIYKDLVIKCGFVILPSCSEGMSSSITTCMYSGLIPIVTKECGINLVKNMGILIPNISTSSIEKVLDLSQSFNNEKMEKESVLAGKIALRDYTIDNYKKNLLDVISKIMR